tara:strand:+ start:8776 stop:9963 length:1188 start_codon:yes stop_codon:yes gene_type:complete
MIFKKGEFGLLWPFYLDALLSPMLFFLPAFMIVYFRTLDFSLFQIGIIMAMAPLFMLLFEVPTGAFADLYGRKYSVLLGMALEGIGFFSIFFMRDYYFILGAFALIGFGSTFSSGAGEAWVTDLIKGEKKDFLHGYFVKMQSFDSFGLVVSGILGVFIVKTFGLGSIWLVTGGSFLLSFILDSFAKENFVRKKSSVSESFKKLNRQGKEAVNYSRKHGVLFYFIIASAILVLSGTLSSHIAWVPFLQDLGFQDHWFGYMWSAMAAVGIFAPSIGMKFYKKNKERGFLMFSIIASSILLLLILLANNLVFGFAILLGTMFFFFMQKPVERSYFHRFVPSKIRASVGSVESMVLSLIAILSLPIAGFLIDKIGAQYTIFIGGILAIPAAIVYWRIKE